MMSTLRKNLLIAFFALMVIRVSAQYENNLSTVDVEYLFKVSILLDNYSCPIVEKKTNKGQFEFESYINSHSLKLDTLEAIRTGSFGNSQFDYFQFYEIDILDGIICFENSSTCGPISGMVSTYIICVNHNSGAIYRLRGFNGNDFRYFLIDLGQLYYKLNEKEISKSKIINNFFVEHLVFKELFKALKATNKNWKKHRCLNRCIDPVIVY